MAIINIISSTFMSNENQGGLRKNKFYESILYNPSSGLTPPIITNLPVIDKRMEHLATNYFSRESSVRRRSRAR